MYEFYSFCCKFCSFSVNFTHFFLKDPAPHMTASPRFSRQWYIPRPINSLIEDVVRLSSLITDILMKILTKLNLNQISRIIL